MSNENKILIGIGVVTLLLVGIAVFSLSGTSGTEANEENATPIDNKILLNKASFTIGPKNAKVTIVEFGDFQCPACKTSQPILKRILSEYKNDVVLVFRHYPLPGHKNSRIAAYAAEAAGAQGKFFEMHDTLYEHQNDWAESQDPLKQHYLLYAKKLKLDTTKFEKAVKEAASKAKIDKDISDGNAAGVNATPTFYINGIQTTGGIPYDEFKQKIEKALQKSSQ